MKRDFESKMKELEEINDALASGGIALEDAVEKYCRRNRNRRSAQPSGRRESNAVFYLMAGRRTKSERRVNRINREEKL